MHASGMAGAMTVSIIVGALVAICLLVAAERLLKLRRQARQRRQMAYRLSKAAARAEVAERKRKATMAASAELTSVLPAINQPKPTFDGVLRQAHRTRFLRLPGSHSHGPHSTGPQRLGTGGQPHSTGPQRLGTQPHSTGPQRHSQGPLRQDAGTAAARPRCPEQRRPAAEQDPDDHEPAGQAPGAAPAEDAQAAE